MDYMDLADRYWRKAAEITQRIKQANGLCPLQSRASLVS